MIKAKCEQCGAEAEVPRWQISSEYGYVCTSCIRKNLLGFLFGEESAEELIYGCPGEPREGEKVEIIYIDEHVDPGR